MTMLKGIKVVINAKGRNLTEHPDNEQTSDREISSSKYVETTTGAAFKVMLFVPKTFAFTSSALDFKIFANGVEVVGALCRKKSSHFKRGHDWKQECEGSPKGVRGKWQLRPSVFNKIKQEALQGLLLVLRTPSPVRAPPTPPVTPATPRRTAGIISLEERPIEDLTVGEMQELAKKQQARYRQERDLNAKSENVVKIERGIKREHDEEVEELIESASATKLKS